MRALLRRSLIIAVVVASCAPTPTAKLPLTCGATTGGRVGAETQLRFVEASDTEIVLTFGASSASNVFDVPAFELTPLEGTSGRRAYRLHVRGTSTINPDGTPSYRGLRGLEPGGRTVRGITLIDETDRVMTFTVLLERDVCPFIAAKSYQYGKSPRAQIALTFGRGDARGYSRRRDVLLRGVRYALVSDGTLASPDDGWAAFCDLLIPPLVALGTEKPRLRACGNRRCGWLFIDRSANGRRRWCDPLACGNRMKVRRYRARH